MNQYPQSTRIKIYFHKNEQWEEYAIAYMQLIDMGDNQYLRGIQQSEPVLTRLVQVYPGLSIEDNCCLNLRLNPQQKYERQGDNIITWREYDLDEEIACSFIDVNHCRDIFNQIQQSIGKAKGHFLFDEVEVDILPSHQNLDACQVQINDNPEHVINVIKNNKAYLEHMCKTFSEAEAQNQIAVLDALYHLVRVLIFLKDEEVIELLLSDRYYMTTFGIMEYHQDNTGKLKVSYRNFLNKLQYHPLFQITGPTQQKIHFNYRLSYLKESVMAYYLYMEDPTQMMFNHIINTNNMNILESLIREHDQELIKFFKFFADDIVLNCKFLNEFYHTFKHFFTIQLPYAQEILKIFVDIMANINFIKILHGIIDANLETENGQFLASSLLQFQYLLISLAPTTFTQQLAEDPLMANNYLKLIFTDYISTHALIVEQLQYLIKPEFETVRSKFKQILECAVDNQQSPQSASLLQQIYTILPYDSQILIGITKLVELLRSKNRLLQIPALKAYRHLLEIDNEETRNKIFQLADLLLNVRLNQNEGVLEGQLRDIVNKICKQTWAWKFEMKVKSAAYFQLFKGDIILIDCMRHDDEEKYFEADEEIVQQTVVPQFEETDDKLKKMIESLKRKDSDEDYEPVLKRISFGDEIIKKMHLE